MSGCTCRNAVPIVEHLPLLQVLRNSQQGLLLQSAGESCVFAYYVCLGVFQLSNQMKILTNIAVKVEKATSYTFRSKCQQRGKLQPMLSRLLESSWSPSMVSPKESKGLNGNLGQRMADTTRLDTREALDWWTCLETCSIEPVAFEEPLSYSFLCLLMSSLTKLSPLLAALSALPAVSDCRVFSSV